MLINATTDGISILAMEGVKYHSGSKSHWSATELITVIKEIPIFSFI